MTDTTRIIDEIRAALDDEAIACFPDFTAAVRALLDHITAQAEKIERVSDLLTAAVDDYNGALARVRELEGAYDMVANWIVEGTEDLPGDTPVTIKIGDRSTIFDELKNLRAILTGEQQ